MADNIDEISRQCKESSDRAVEAFARNEMIIKRLTLMQAPMKALGDGLRHPTDEELIDEAAAACQRVSAICREMKQTFPVKFDAEIAQNIELLHDVLNNFAGMRMSYYSAKYGDEQ